VRVSIFLPVAAELPDIVRNMAHILIEENFRQIDGQDMEALLEALNGLGLDAEPTGPRTSLHRHGWVLVLHCLDDQARTITEPAKAAAFGLAVRQIFGSPRPADPVGGTAGPRTLPDRIDVRNRDRDLIVSLPIPAQA
jgi:hypothetical protein